MFKNRKTEWKALDTYILVVAVEGYGGIDWAAYISRVPGHCHDEEWETVVAHGSKLDKAIAKAIFPNWQGRYRE